MSWSFARHPFVIAGPCVIESMQLQLDTAGTLKEITGGDKLDAGPMIEYFTPVNEWLKQQNQGQMCGWQPPGAAAAPKAP